MSIKSQFAALACSVLALSGCGQKTTVATDAKIDMKKESRVISEFERAQKLKDDAYRKASYTGGQATVNAPDINMIIIYKYVSGAQIIDCTDKTVSNAKAKTTEIYINQPVYSYLEEPTGSPVPFNQFDKDVEDRFRAQCKALAAAKAAAPK